jgi:NodT family efflux transporter outer membrane factor (OMF) lipoprotein
VAQAYFNYQIELQRQKVSREMIKQREALLKLSAARLARGLDPVQPRRQIEADIANARFTIAQIDASVMLGRDQLAALLGVGAGDLPAIAPVGPPAVKAGLPENLTIDLVGRRPDIQAQRWRVEAGLRQIDVAKTQFYPNLSVGAFLGLSSIGLGKLLQGSSEVAGVAPALRLPLFDSGRLTANLGAARASLDTAIAQYNQTLVEAVRQVADQAATLAGIADQETALAEAQRTVQRLQALSETRFKAGLTDASAVLVAQTAVLMQADLQAQLAGRRLAAQVALIRALGGGYTGAQPSGAAGVAR